jgi:A/G-specific adenine glycosylase
MEQWFTRNQRPLPWRAACDPWEVWVSEVMLQQTRMEVVLRYFGRFLERFPTPAALAEADEDAVLALWSGMGYYRRARMLRQGARHVVSELGGSIPATVEELRKIPGVGRYTAGAIASIAFDQRSAIVDGNVARLLARLEGLEHPLRSSALAHAEWAIAESLVAAASSPRAFNQSMMELGARICRPRDPLCGECPVRLHCKAFRAGRQEDLPRPAPRRATSQIRIALYVVSDDRGRILMKRASGELMAGMFHLPHGDDGLMAGASGSFSPSHLLGSFRHTVTHRRIRFDVYEAVAIGDRARESAADHEWVDPAELGSYPHPSYVKKALRIAVDARG